MPETDLNSIVQLATQGLFSVVFLWLYMAERKAHEETRKMLYETLREVAGMRVNLLTQRQQEAITRPVPIPLDGHGL